MILQWKAHTYDFHRSRWGSTGIYPKDQIVQNGLIIPIPNGNQIN